MDDCAHGKGGKGTRKKLEGRDHVRKRKVVLPKWKVDFFNNISIKIHVVLLKKGVKGTFQKYVFSNNISRYIERAISWRVFSRI